MDGQSTPVTPKTDQQIADMAPAERDQYFQEQANATGGDGGMFAFIERFGARLNAQGKADQVGAENRTTIENSGDIKYVKGLDPSDADYMGHEHEQLQTFVTTNNNAEQVTNVSTAYHKVHEAFDTFGKTLTTAVNKSKGEWEGSSAGSAQGYFSSLSTWADANSTNAKLASETIYDQQTAASLAKNKMPEPIKFDMSDELGKWTDAKDPVSFAKAVSDTYKTYDSSKKAHTEAAGVMSQYDKELYSAASKQPAFAEPPKFGQGSGEEAMGPIGSGITVPGGDGGGDGSTGSSGVPGGGGSGVPGGGGGGGSSNPGGGGYNPPPTVAPPGPGTGSGTLPGGTTPSTYLPPGGNGGGSSNIPSGSSPGMGGMGAMPMGGMGGGAGMGGGSEYSSKLGRGGGGGFGPGGSGTGSTPGNSSGAARPGGVGASESAAGRSMGAGGAGAGGSGRGGAGGMGRGKGGQGEEDQEHQRPTYLVEGDPDEVFGSDMRTAPPVIGE